jgi:hypothetical protein
VTHYLNCPAFFLRCLVELDALFGQESPWNYYLHLRFTLL